MRIGVIQSSYVPWRGYFDFIREVDLFVFYDDLQFSKGSWRNRNRIKTPAGLKWLTVPVKIESLAQLICNTRIEYSIDWQVNQLNQLGESYRNAPFFGDAEPLLKEAFGYRDETISELNIRLIRLVSTYLGITTPTQLSTEYSLAGTKTERLIGLLHKTGATTYLSGPSARDYLDERLFIDNGIRLEYKSYDYAPYPQLWGGYEGAVTILDLIANCGAGAKGLLQSSTPNLIAVP